MRVATWHGGTRFTLDEVPDPAPGPGEVVVRVDTVGICGTDVHITQGLFPATPPAVLGHEFSGTIAAVGPDVSRARRGEAVACDITSHCLACVECREGRWNRCVHARKASGALAEYARVPADCALALPPGLDLATASLTEPASCALSGLEAVAMPPGAVAVVIGGGVIGLFAAAFAKARGAATVLLSDPIAARREMARQLGADLVNDPTRQDLGELVRSVTEGRGAHVVCEAVGKPELVARAIALARPRGTVIMLGVNPRGSTLPSDLYDLHYREITLRGAFGRGSAFARALQLLSSLSLAGIITVRYPLERVSEAFAAAAEGRGVKTAISPNGG